MHQKNFVSQTLVQNTVINLQVLLSPIIGSKDFLQFLRRPFTPWTLTPIMSKEPTRAQLSSRLAYHGKMPAFLQKLQKQVNGSGGGGESDEEDDEWEYDGSGRPPIPKRPAIPERPADNPGSADEDDDLDEKPQIVVLREGKHLSEREVENEKRRGQCGLLTHDARGCF